MFRAPFFASLLLACTVAAATSGAMAETAAEVDWLPRDELPPAMQDALPWFCDGGYVEPVPTTLESGTDVIALADETEQKIGEYVDLRGNVVLEYGYTRIQAPRLVYNEESEAAEIFGPLLLREEGIAMTGASADANLVDGTGTILNASFLFHEFQLRGQADRVERSPSRDVTLRRASFTRCEPHSNEWSVQSRRIRLHPDEGYGTAKNVTVRVGDVPVFYSPYFRFPLGSERQSGFLMPSGGYDSDSGTELTIPYYINIAPWIDATYELQHLWRRGTLHDWQVRFLAGRTANEVNLGYLPGDDLYDPRTVFTETDDDAPPVEPFEKQDRWYLNFRHESEYTSRWKSTVDYNVVSDIDYLTDLDARIGSTEIEDFTRSSGSSVIDRRAPALEQMGKLEYRGRRWRHSIVLQGFQPLDPDARNPYEKLPEISSRYTRHAGPGRFDLEIEYANFHKEDEGLTGLLGIVGSRVVTDAEFSIRGSTAWGYVEPAVGFVHRQYELSRVPAGIDSSPDSTIPRFSLDSGLVFDRFFEAADETWQQTLEPRAFFLYVEPEDQDELPQFDVNPASSGYSTLFRIDRFPGRDRIGDARHLALGLTSRLIRRDTGAEFLQASVGQIHYFRDRIVTFRPQPGEDPTRDFSPLYARGQLNLQNGIRIKGSYEWEPDAGRSNRGTLSVEYRSDDWRRLVNLRYIYANPLVEQITEFRSEEESDLSVIWPLYGAARNFSVIGRWNFGWDRNQTIESLLGVEYNNCCFKTRLVVRRFLQSPRDITIIRDDPANPGEVVVETRTITPADKGIFIEFQFKGLATLGRRLDILLDRAIPGYRERETIVGR